VVNREDLKPVFGFGLKEMMMMMNISFLPDKLTMHDM
jgi:hypothetical protein